MNLKKGALHRDLGVPVGKKIPMKKLMKAAHEKGIKGKRARLAVLFRKFKRTGKEKKGRGKKARKERQHQRTGHSRTPDGYNLKRTMKGIREY